jgi:predicted ATP-dependent protease
LSARALQPEELAGRCDPALLEGLEAAAAAHGDDGIVGQERARRALEFGLAMRAPGWHLFVAGAPGSGRRSLVRCAIDAQRAREPVVRSDWVYVVDFERPHRPIAIELPAGRGIALRAQMRALVEELGATIPAAFESEEYSAEVQLLTTDFKERAERALAEVGEQAREQGLAMLRTPVGFTFAPRAGDAVMTPQAFQALEPTERDRLQKAMEALQEKLLGVLRASMRLRKEHADRLRTLNRATSKLAVDHAVDEALSKWSDQPAVSAHLEAVRAAAIDDADAFRPHEDGEAQAPADALARYEVNLLVDAGHDDAEPIVEADLPTWQNLIGRVDHVAQFGMLLTDFRHVKAGVLHRANGGWLLVDAMKLLSQPFAWVALKRALLRREIRIEPMAEMLFGMASTVQLEPQPIPLRVKVILFGEREIWELLRAHDPEFEELFRVVADLEDDLPRDVPTQRALARTLWSQVREGGLLEASPGALARVIDHGARRAGDATRIDAGVRQLLDVLAEADHVARAAGRVRIEADDVVRAITERRERSRRVDARLRDAMLRALIAIDTDGARAGQINGLAAYRVGDETFGAPSRITATVRLGDGQVIDIQRETQLGGPLHSKGVMILSSFLASRFARLHPLSIHASLVFEQTYGPVEGDSASLAELIALITAIADVPVNQAIAVTGSVDQFGTVQAVGAVDEKLEGFFDLCAARGLDGRHGAIVPASNATRLMLREDLVEAVRAGRFAVHAVHTVDDALERLTGWPAGDPGVPSESTVNGRVTRRLRELAGLRRGEPRLGSRRGARTSRRSIGGLE